MTLADLSAFLFPYRTHLQIQLRDQRTEFEKRLAEKDAEIRRLRGELANKGVRMEAADVEAALKKHRAQIDNGRTPTAALAQELSGPLDWQGELTQMLKEEEEKSDGVPSE